MSVILPVRWSSGNVQKCTCLPDSADQWLSQDIGTNSFTITQSVWFRATDPAGSILIHETIPATPEEFAYGETSPGDPNIEVRIQGLNSVDQIRFIAHTNRVTQSTQIDILDGNWHHVVWSANSVNAIHCVVDGVLQVLSSVDVNTNGWLLKHDRKQIVGSSINGCISDFYWHPDYIDLNVQSNREQFYSGVNVNEAGWIYYGDDGSNPQGTQPLVWLRDEDGNFGTNYGSRANFDLVGTPVGGVCTI